MQILANMTTKLDPNDTGRDTAGKYRVAKNFALASGAISVGGSTTGGMQHTHQPVTYYLIAHNDFKSI